MGLKGIWEQERLQRLDEIAQRKQKDAQRKEQNRSEQSIMSDQLTKDLQEFKNNLEQEISQTMADFREEDIQRQNLVKQMHQTALEQKKKRQNEIAKRKEYVWGS